jgi:hypothetical protein
MMDIMLRKMITNVDFGETRDVFERMDVRRRIMI